MNSQQNKKYSFISLFLWGKGIYSKIPPFFRWVFIPLKWVLTFISVFRFDLWVITGEEIKNKQALGILYAGSKENKNYMINLTFDSPYEENYIGNIWIWEVLKKVKEKNHNCSLMIAEVPKFFSLFFKNKKWFYIPCWISGEIDISKEIFSLITKESLKSDIRKIKKNNLSFESTNEISQLHDFYHNMYLPYITEAHNDEAFVTGYDFVKEEFKNCDLIFIKSKEEYIGGILIRYAGERARLWYIGVKDGNRDYLQQGLVGALYYFSFCYLKARGFRKVGLGGTRAFLKDGVLQYKKKWSMRIISAISASQTGFFVNILPERNSAKGFFLNNPFIYMDKGKLEGAIFIENDQLLSEKDFRKIYKDYYMHGISKLIIYRFGGSLSNAKETVPPDLSGSMEIRSAESFF